MLNTMVADSTPSRDLKPSQELLEKIAEARDLAKRFGQSAIEIVKQAYELAIRDGFHPLQARDFLIAQLPFLGESTIRKALPPEAKEQSKVRLRSSVAQNKEPKESNVVNITTSHKVIEQSYDPEEEIKKIGEIRRDLAKKDAEAPIVPDDEDPKDLEIQFLKEKVAELEDALKKTEQFKPATQLHNKGQVETFPPLQEEEIFNWLGKRDDKIKCFYFGSAATGFIKSNILANLENSGIKVFKRLYFEV